MEGWKRITLVSFVLIGSATFFSYWSINQFNQAFDNLSAAYLADTHLVYSSFKQKTKDETIPIITSTTTAAAVSTSSENSPQATTPATANSTNLEISFTFPQQGAKTYIGCTYQISWQSSTTIQSLEAALVDTGTREAMGPIASGLAKENTIERDSQNLKWKVGNVWPGAYYIAVSKINGVKAEFGSDIFKINKMSKNIGTREKENVCKESGGSF